jgi:hypothetical protein
MIDIRTKPDRLAVAVKEAQRSRPPRAVLVRELPDGVEVVDGHAYLGNVPVTTDPKVTPPPRPKTIVLPKPRHLADLKAERIAELQQAIRDHVDAHMPPNEREGLAALMQKTTLMRLMGAPVDEGASLALVMSLSWAESAMVAGDDIAQACAKATSAEELQAITVDLKSLGTPPKITSGEIAKALRGA